MDGQLQAESQTNATMRHRCLESKAEDENNKEDEEGEKIKMMKTKKTKIKKGRR